MTLGRSWGSEAPHLLQPLTLGAGPTVYSAQLPFIV